MKANMTPHSLLEIAGIPVTTEALSRLTEDASEPQSSPTRQPTSIDANGSQIWQQNGKRHREDGPAVIDADGSRIWYQNGKIHREDGPAMITANGTKFWYQNGKIHREDGPAVIYASGKQEWYLNGIHLTEAEFNARMGSRD